MFEDAIAQLDSMGIPYTDNGDGTMTIDIATADKTQVVDVVSFLNDNMLEYTISQDSIVVSGGDVMETEEPAAEDEMAGMDAALAGMGF